MAQIDESPKHGTTNETPESQSQADGTGANAPRGETQAQSTKQMNPSAPTEGTEVGQALTKGAPLNDAFGEAGDPHGRGNLEVPDTVVDSGPNPTANEPGTEAGGDLPRKHDEEAA